MLIEARPMRTAAPTHAVVNDQFSIASSNATRPQSTSYRHARDAQACSGTPASGRDSTRAKRSSPLQPAPPANTPTAAGTRRGGHPMAPATMATLPTSIKADVISTALPVRRSTRLPISIRAMTPARPATASMTPTAPADMPPVTAVSVRKTLTPAVAGVARAAANAAITGRLIWAIPRSIAGRSGSVRSRTVNRACRSVSMSRAKGTTPMKAIHCQPKVTARTGIANPTARLAAGSPPPLPRRRTLAGLMGRSRKSGELSRCSRELSLPSGSGSWQIGWSAPSPGDGSCCSRHHRPALDHRFVCTRICGW
jgi:hypothetical protein